MSLLASILGFGKLLTSMAVEGIKGLIKLFTEKPVLGAAIVLALTLAGTLWLYSGVKSDLEDAKSTIEQKNTYIKEQAAKLDTYVKALDVERTNHQSTIKDHNAAVDSIKQAADRASANAQAEAKKAEAKRREYIALAERYKDVELGGTAEERIAREESTNDKFFQDWKVIR